MAKCSRCNNEIEDNTMFCEHCGAAVDKEEYTQNGYDLSKAKAVAVVIAILAVIGIVGFAIFKIAGGSGVSADNYVKNWNNRVEIEKEDLASVYEGTIIEEMLTELDMEDADKNGNTYEFELYELYTGDKAILTFEAEGVGTVTEVSVLMETEVFYAFVNNFYNEEDALEGVKKIHTLALGSMLKNKAAYRDAAEIVDDAWDDFLENMDEYYDEDESAWIFNKKYDNIEITIEEENVESEDFIFTAKRV